MKKVFTAFFWKGNPAEPIFLHFITVDTVHFGLEKDLTDPDNTDLVYHAK